MKKISIIAAATALTLSQGVFAKDIEKGTISLSGSTNGGLSFLTTEVDTLDTEFDITTINLESFVRYFVKENIAIGVGYSFDNTNVEYEGGLETEETTLVIEPGAFYNHSINEDNSILFGASIGFGTIESSETGSETEELDLSSFTLGASFQHFINDSVALNADAAYVTTTLEEDSSGTEAETSGLVFGVGATIYFSGY
jgi:hypothetical protein